MYLQYIRTYVHIYMYICMHVCMYLHIQGHAHTHSVSMPAGRFANVFTCSMAICVCKGILYSLHKKLAKLAFDQ